MIQSFTAGQQHGGHIEAGLEVIESDVDASWILRQPHHFGDRDLRGIQILVRPQECTDSVSSSPFTLNASTAAICSSSRWRS